MAEQRWIFSLLSILLVTLRFECLIGKEIKVPVGIVLDQNSTVGEMAENFMAMAISDFYAANDNYQTRLSLIKRDSRGDVVSAASAVLDLMENEEVQAIIGPQSSSQANFVIELGGKAQVPIISFSATSPSLSPAKSQYFVRTAHNDSFQVKAIASIVHAYGWQEIVIIYEDTDYGNGLIPYLLDSFQELGTRIFCRINILASYTDNEITRELNNMKNKRRSIFVVHMAATNGARLFSLAKKVGMMGEGYAWLVTQGLSILLDPVDEKVMMDSMLGVLGVRPYIPNSEKLKKFKPRWEKNFSSNRKLDELNLFGLWAYDTIWAIAMAVEKTVDNVKSSSLKHNRTGQSTRINLEAAIGISSMGPKLLKSILSTSFQGLSGEFHLAKGELKPKALEIFNVIGNKERILGYYSLNGVLSKSLTSKDKFKQPLWPGDTLEQPRKLRIGVPVKTGFSEFMKVKWHPETAEPIVSGFSADVFREMHKMLPFPLPYEFIPFADKDRKSRGTYDQLLDQIRKQEVDAAVGDITVVAKRSLFVDFTLPFSESGVSMVVLMKHDERDNMWIFLKPLSRNLWLTTALAFIFTGLVVWVLEHRINTDFRGPPDQQFSTVFWFSFSTLVFAHSNFSKFFSFIITFLFQFHHWLLNLGYMYIEN
uniref:Ionotropic glutamate receptor C-terminal domain-containing protein n=1 Tax=Manihot esculenta TaxID=3983 RepID=A0A2C9UX45_MANES